MKAPIFIVGTGRCGSTIFFKLLSHHPDLCWHSTLENKYPDSSIVRSLSRYLNRDPYHSVLSKLYSGFKPGEIWNIWEKADPDFVEPPRPPGAEDVTEEKKKRLEVAKQVVAEKFGIDDLREEYGYDSRYREEGGSRRKEVDVKSHIRRTQKGKPTNVKSHKRSRPKR